MTLRRIRNLKSPIGKVIDAADEDGVLLEREGRRLYAVIPLDDELLDYLLERNPALIRQCERIRRQMKRGVFRSHDEVKQMLGERQRELRGLREMIRKKST